LYTIKILDGTIIRTSVWGKTPLALNAITITSTDRIFAVGITKGSSDFVYDDARTDTIITSWDYLMLDDTCSFFNFG